MAAHPMPVRAAAMRMKIRSAMAVILRRCGCCHQWQRCRLASISCQICASMVVMISNVATIVYDGVAPFELGVLCEAFGVDRTDDGLPRFDFALCGVRAGT